METKPRGYWDIKENNFNEARKYTSRTEFRNGNDSCYRAALRNGWIDEMDWLKRPVVHNKKWTKKAVFAKAREYPTRSDFAKGCPSAYDAARRNGWLKEMYWFKEGKKPNNYWNNWERVFEEARKYPTREDFKRGCPSAYNSAYKNGWINELFPKCEKWNKGKHLSEEHKKKISETNINGKLSKAVLQCDLGGNIIAEFPSVAEVQRQFGFRNISSCCIGKRKSAYNFIWRYKESVA